ncbi:MAG: hypothetical protein E6579_00890 [Clostridium sp.]|nr:hypothetical protein [Clostridium sp.]
MENGLMHVQRFLSSPAAGEEIQKLFHSGIPNHAHRYLTAGQKN